MNLSFRLIESLYCWLCAGFCDRVGVLFSPQLKADLVRSLEEKVDGDVWNFKFYW